MVALVYGFHGMLDTMRARIMGDVTNALERPLSARVQQAMLRSSPSSAAGTSDPLQPLRDLDHVRAFLGGSGPMTLLDLPWVIFFLLILSLLHVYLGLTALLGATALFGLTLFTDRATRDPVRTLAEVTGHRPAWHPDTRRPWLGLQSGGRQRDGRHGSQRGGQMLLRAGADRHVAARARLRPVGWRGARPVGPGSAGPSYRQLADLA